jgi:hypothetical protein
MRSSTSNSDASSTFRFLVAAALTFFVLLGTWERLLRQRASATVDLNDIPTDLSGARRGEEWILSGNCLVMTGVSPRRLEEQLGGDSARSVVSIARHEQSPFASFVYLRESAHYPAVIVTNVSSWLNGTNFDQEGALMSERDPLAIRRGDRPATSGQPGTSGSTQAFRQDRDVGHGALQERVEQGLSDWTSTHLASVGHRYHLFDYTLFAWTLLTGLDLDNALYQLNMQSWYRVTKSESDGLGYLGLQVSYRDDWNVGLDRMAERSLSRMRLAQLLTPRYWTRLEEEVRHFHSHGTEVVFVRMPEHPKIREFNDATYSITEHLSEIERGTGAPTLDLSKLGPADGVRLFDAVHPDAAAADVITRELAVWLRARRTKASGFRASAAAGNR